MTGGYGDSELAKPDLDADLIPDPQPTPNQELSQHRYSNEGDPDALSEGEVKVDPEDA